ncbi:MAG TPA: hypothetical protein VKP30_01030 [Polyangiaceae bacterium]|nr:hypothetical protein [Polyangiaceae bacterium]
MASPTSHTPHGPAAIVPATSNRLSKFLPDRRGLAESAAWAWLLLAIAAALLLVERPQNYFWLHFSNMLHVLFSVGLGVVLLRISRLWLSRVLRRGMHYALAGCAVVGLGAIFEVAQGFSTGTASRSDVVLDAAGGLTGLMLALSFDSIPLSRLARIGLRVGALAVLLLGLFPSLRAMRRGLLHRVQFPLLASFEHPWEQVFLKARDSDELSFVPPPPEFVRAHGRRVAKSVFIKHGERPPAVRLVDLGQDWSRFSSLDFEIFAPAGQPPVNMTLSLHDDGPMGYDEHFNLVMEIKPGTNTISVPREFIRTGASNRPMHLDKFHELVLFIEPPESPKTFYFDHFRLTP